MFEQNGLKYYEDVKYYMQNKVYSWQDIAGRMYYGVEWSQLPWNEENLRVSLIHVHGIEMHEHLF